MVMEQEFIKRMNLIQRQLAEERKLREAVERKYRRALEYLVVEFGCCVKKKTKCAEVDITRNANNCTCADDNEQIKCADDYLSDDSNFSDEDTGK